MKEPEIRGRGRPRLPAGEALGDGARVSVRLDARDAAMLRELAAALDVSEAEAMRMAMHALHARKVRS